eukprot:TRINITY_DN426_c0_g1_i1.p1 TRINITY_DN426_c0_g1~~TRINITY_DN426_c0_g1_i1.p1  ORF type:complete len:103 (-),score=41.97 TRINITY_DN426_c0_g1_i1:779-1045(-)
MLRNLNRVVFPAFQRRMMSGGEQGQTGVPGSGVGKGGGGGGSIREAGGAFGKREAAMEDQFFYEQQKEQLHELHEKQEKDKKGDSKSK